MALCLLFLAASLAVQANVFITEVADPSDQYTGRYVEIYNSGSSAVDLTGWQIRRYANDSTTSGDIDLSGTIAAGGFYIVANSDTDFNTFYGMSPDLGHGYISGNGNDAYELYNGSSVVDIFGTIGDDTYFYADSIAQRAVTVTTGNPTYTASEWIIQSGGTADATPYEWDGAAGGDPAEVPANQPTSLVFDMVLGARIDGSFTASTGTPAADGYVVVMDTDSSLNGTPVDTTYYSAGDTIGDGTVISFGSTTSFSANGLSNNTTYHFFVFAYGTGVGGPKYKTASPLTDSEDTLTQLLFKDFEDDSLVSGGWQLFNLTGVDQEWVTYTLGGGAGIVAKMSGYAGSAVENEDWFISPAFNFDANDGEILTFSNAYNYADEDSDITVKVSTNYSGSGDPTVATWTDLTFTRGSGSSWDFVESGQIDLSSFTGTGYLAFRYYSGTDQAATWELDDISIVGGGVLDDPNLSANSAINFGAVTVGESASQNLTITNTGSAQTLTIDAGTTLTGTDKINFSILSSLPITLNPGDSADLTVQFTPNAKADFAATLALSSNDMSENTINVALSGSGVVEASGMFLYEPFDYATGDLTNSANWEAYAADGDANVQVSANSLSYTGMPASTGNKAVLQGVHPSQDINAAFADDATVNSGSVFASFLLNVTTAPSNTDSNSKFFAFRETAGSSNNSQGELRIVGAGSGYKLGISMGLYMNDEVSWYDTELATGQAYLVVVKYTIGSGADDDSMDLWVNPTVGSTAPTANVSRPWTGGEFSDYDLNPSAGEVMSGVNLIQESWAADFVLEIDELRVGDSWAAAMGDSGPVEEPVSLVITEILYDSNGQNADESKWEWVEVYNASESTINLENFVFADGTGLSAANVGYCEVPAGETAVLFNGNDNTVLDFRIAWGKVRLAPVTNWPNLSNMGEKIAVWESYADYLGANWANALDVVEYDDGGDWPVGETGKSIYLTDLAADNNAGANWAICNDETATPLGEGKIGGYDGMDIGAPVIMPASVDCWEMFD